jgi:hypothetical protein
MGAKSVAAVLGLAVGFEMALWAWAGEANAFEEGVHTATYKPHVARVFGPRWHYAPVVVTALFDSCWRYRLNREPARIWTCGNYIKPNADFDWSYGNSIADLACRYCGPR